MSNLPIIQGASRFETLGLSSGSGATVTSGAANAKGSYTTLGTTGFRYGGIALMLGNANSTARFRIDLAVNTGISTQIIAEDLFADFKASATQVEYAFNLPLRIPAGASVMVRAQSTTASQTVQAALLGWTGNFAGDPGYRALKCLTDWTNTDPTNLIATGTSAGTTAWTQVQASTPSRVAAIMMLLDSAGGSGRTASSMSIDIGWGNAGSERVLASVFQVLASSPLACVDHGPFPCDIPAGTRLATRATLATAQATSTSFGTPLYGLAL